MPTREITGDAPKSVIADYGGTWGSCGIGELYGVHGANPEQLLAAVMTQEVSSQRGYSQYIFTDNFTSLSSGGPGLAAFIEKHKLGDLQGGTTCINKNTGNEIAAWIWIPNRKAIAAYFKKVKG